VNYPVGLDPPRATLHIDDVGGAVSFEPGTNQLAGVRIDVTNATAAAAGAGPGSVAATTAAEVDTRYNCTLAIAFALLPLDRTPPPPHRRLVQCAAQGMEPRNPHAKLCGRCIAALLTNPWVSHADTRPGSGGVSPPRSR